MWFYSPQISYQKDVDLKVTRNAWVGLQRPCSGTLSSRLRACLDLRLWRIVILVGVHVQKTMCKNHVPKRSASTMVQVTTRWWFQRFLFLPLNLMKWFLIWRAYLFWRWVAQPPTRCTTCKNPYLGMQKPHSQDSSLKKKTPGFHISNHVSSDQKPSYLLFIGDLYSPVRDLQCHCGGSSHEAIRIFMPSCTRHLFYTPVN